MAILVGVEGFGSWKVRCEATRSSRVESGRSQSRFGRGVVVGCQRSGRVEVAIGMGELKCNSLTSVSWASSGEACELLIVLLRLDPNIPTFDT